MSGLAVDSYGKGYPVPASLFEDSQRDALIEKLEGTNINTKTLLTTDYLNHFSAIYMILEMMPDDPKMFAADILAWEPKTYAEHLTESGFRDSELAIICYEHCSSDVRKAFDKIIGQLHDATRLTIESLSNALDHERLDHIHQICEDAIPQIRQLVEHAASVVNGDRDLIAGICLENREEEHQTSSQEDIDALFK